MTHALDWDAAGTLSAAGAEWRRRQAAFRAARRHSRVVRILRVLLPAAAVATIVAMFVATRLSLPGDVDLSVARMSVTKNAIIMESPRLTGFDADNRGYTVAADRAIQALTNPDAVTLEAIKATLTVEGRGTTTIAAATGEYDNGAGKLALMGGVVVDSPDGYALRMRDVKIDMKAGTLATQNPVTIVYETSETTGRSMSATGGGSVIVLEGVRSILMPPKRPAGATP